MANQEPYRVCASFSSQLGTEKQAMDMVEPFLQKTGGNLQRLKEIQIALAEACLNAIEHGNRCDPSIHYVVELLSGGSGVIIIRVYDQGTDFPRDGIPLNRTISMLMNSEEETRGWGLLIIDRLADEWKFHGGPPKYIEMRFS
jgi:anti-sigma regulatory factor (Ser/Thr protein kinase)